MIHELRIYTLHVGKVPEYVKLFEEKGLHVITRHLPLIGWWTSDTGELNRVFHMCATSTWSTAPRAASVSTRTRNGRRASCRSPFR